MQDVNERHRLYCLNQTGASQVVPKYTESSAKRKETDSSFRSGDIEVNDITYSSPGPRPDKRECTASDDPWTETLFLYRVIETKVIHRPVYCVSSVAVS